MKILVTKDIHLWKFETILEHMNKPALKENNMTRNCRDNHNKGTPYIFTCDSKFKNLLDILN